MSGEGHGTALVASSILAERRAPHPNPLPAKSGAREQISARGNHAYFLTSPRPFAGRGRNSSIARISGEGHGTAPVASSILAERSAPHPNPLPAKIGAREHISARGNRAYFPFPPFRRTWLGR